MKKIFISRRTFMKKIVAGCVFTQLMSSVYLIKENAVNDDSVLNVEQDYIILNGWVLLKSDIALD